MDIVRLALERATSAAEAIDVMTALVEDPGQGGSGEDGAGDPYWSSFLVADPTGAWVLETSGRSWAARAVDDAAAISNRLTLGTDWTRASADVAPGDDFSGRGDPGVPTDFADVRLDATRACIASGAAALDARDLVAVLRHHGTRPWGAPGSDPADFGEPPPADAPGTTGVSVCWHMRGLISTTAAMVADLPADRDTPARLWVALGAPCASVFVPVAPPSAATTGEPAGGAAAALAEASTWHRFARLRDRVEADGGSLGPIRAVLGPLETGLWADPDPATAWPRVDAALAELGV